MRARVVLAALTLAACGEAAPPVRPLAPPPIVAPPPQPAAVVDAGAPPIAVEPWEAPLDPTKLTAIDAAVNQAIAEGKLPGAVVEIGRRSGPVFTKAYGNRQIQPFVEPMTTDTVFDMASITKSMATAASILILVEREKLTLDEPASKIIGELASYGKGDITIRQLLTHTAGLRADTPLDDTKLGHAEMLRRAIAAPLRAKPGERVLYSDVGYLFLQEIVERTSGKPLDVFAHDALYAPLALTETTFNPPAELRARAVTTETRDGGWMKGVVHDPRAAYLGGVAGHAGLFSTAHDVGRFARAMLAGGELDDVRVMSPRTVDAFFAPYDLPAAIRAPGWDVQSAFSSNRGSWLSRRAVGHGGYTGTSLWIDPGLDLYVVVLSNRVHPDGKGSVNPLAGKIADIAAASIAGALPTVLPPVCEKRDVLTGVDVLEREKFVRLRGLHLALLTNQTGRDRTGARTIDLLHAADGVDLVSIWSPEHGVEGLKDEKVDDATDEATNLPVFSLYGARHSPDDAMMNGIDAVVIDLQDAGARFFTYASTMHRVLKVAAARGVKIYVLDRPNPIDGVTVAGPVSSAASLNFVNHLPLPTRHGMTMGELAELANAEEHLGARLEVVRMENWRRTSLFDDTSLPWQNPSPNLRSSTEALLYPGVALLEGANVSVGRGTDTPFEVVGAPWIDGKTLARALGQDGLVGVSFVATTFTPSSGPFANQAIGGVKISVTDRTHVDPVKVGLAIART
ncbi:MAG TPA: exo-beta-N-acetylmuramidase NamZ domain-containing protein, partial [Polyangiaceae bacterium]